MVIFDSSKVTVSPTLKTLSVKYATSNLFDDGETTTLATALLVLPMMFSPIIAFVWTLAVDVNCSVSKVGFPVPKDS